MENADKEYIKGAIEALLFIGEKTVLLEQIQEALETVSAGDIKALIQELQQDYETQKKGITIIDIAGGYQMLTNPHYATYVRNFFKTKVKEKLSRPALETLAIVAYKQPVSRGDIEMIRGVNSDGVAVHLLDKALIKIVGRKDIPGRPYLYGTTKEFLDYFGLKSLKDLPQLEDFVSLPTEQVVEAGARGTDEKMDQDVAAAEAQASQEAEAREAAAAETVSSENAGEQSAEAATPANEPEQSFARGEHEEGKAIQAAENLVIEDPLPKDVRNLKEVMDEMNEERSA
jgi:segregation and condensation protein B